MMIDFDRVHSYSLTAFAEQYTALRRIGGEMHGACPIPGCSVDDDGFFVRRDDESWYCRGCAKGGDLLDLLAAIEGKTIAQAYEQWTGESLRPKTPYAGNESHWQESSWQEYAISTIEKARAAMVSNGPAGGQASKGWHYLHSRGISPATMREFSIGFDAARWDREGNPKRPAILIPWILADGRCCAIKYRFIDDLAGTNKNRRFNQRRGSEPIIFGAQICKGSEFLVITEGEINCMSVYEAKPGWADVVSIGGDTTGTGAKKEIGIQAVLAFAKSRKYKKVLVWCDEVERVKAHGSAIAELNPVLMRSGKEGDANDILQEFGAEYLWALITTVAGISGPNLDPSKIAGAMQCVERIRICADAEVRKMLDELAGYLNSPKPKDASRAVQLASQVASWCNQFRELKDSELATAILRTFPGSKLRKENRRGLLAA